MLDAAAAGISSQFPVTTLKRRLFWFNTIMGQSVPLTVPLLSLKQDGTFPVSCSEFTCFCPEFAKLINLERMLSDYVAVMSIILNCTVFYMVKKVNTKAKISAFSFKPWSLTLHNKFMIKARDGLRVCNRVRVSL